MKNETPFKGSPLFATLNNCNEDKVEFWYYATKAAREVPRNKDSIFWKEAFELIEKKYNKLKNKTNKKFINL